MGCCRDWDFEDFGLFMNIGVGLMVYEYVELGFSEDLVIFIRFVVILMVGVVDKSF